MGDFKGILKGLMDILKDGEKGQIGKPSTCKDWVEGDESDTGIYLCINATWNSGAWMICKQERAIDFFGDCPGGLSAVMDFDTVKGLAITAVSIFLT